MNKRKIIIFLVVTALALLACDVSGLANVAQQAASDVTSGGSGSGLTSVSELWADVPRMDGLTGSDIEMPLVTKIFMQSLMSSALNDANANADLAVFSTTQSVADVQAFYSSERMQAAGWDSSEGADTCFGGGEAGAQDVGLFCVFSKQDSSSQTGLMIIATQNTDNNNTDIFFVRLEGLTTPTP